MQIRFFQHLSFHQARNAVVAGFIIGLMVSVLQITSDLIKEQRQLDATTSQVIRIVQDSAAQAAYDIDTIRAKKIINGLFEYQPISDARLIDDFGSVLAHEHRVLKTGRLDWAVAMIFGRKRSYAEPLFLSESRQSVGQIKVQIDTYLIAENFIDRALLIIIGGIVRNLILACVFTVMFYYSLTRPLLRVVRCFSLVNPAKPAQGQVKSPQGHEHDEMGLLVQTINRLLQELDDTLRRRHQAETTVRELNANLEQRVEKRTAELARANTEISSLNKKLRMENLRMGTELDVVRRLQQMILPKAEELRKIKELDIAGFMEPADEVGGDYYDVLRYDGHIKIAIGDVTGHGLESGVLMMMAQTIVRTLMFSGVTNPVRFLTILNRVIYDNVQRIQADKSMTLALLDYKDGQVRLSGQHEDMIVVRRGGKVELVDTADLGFPVGLTDNIAEFVAETTVVLHPQDVVVLFSDGITESENTDRDLYGLERLCEVVSHNWDQSAKRIKQAVIEDVRQHIGKQVVYDDLTLVVLKQQ